MIRLPVRSLSLLLTVLCGSLALADDPIVPPFTVEAGAHDRHNTPVCLPIDVPEDAEIPAAILLMDASGRTMAGQITGPGLLNDSGKNAELHFILPELAAGESTQIEMMGGPAPAVAGASFRWEENEPGKEMTLYHGEQPVLRYMFEEVDNSSEERRGETYKVYHHLFDPAGERLVTKGPGGLFPHHRGLFYGFLQCTYADAPVADTWHCGHGEWESHEDFIVQEAGPVLGRHVVAVDWHGQDGEVFAHELREMTVYAVPGGKLVQFASTLQSTVGELRLTGDPQHAGFQFRASQDVPDETAAETYYLRPDGRGEPGVFRNWPDNPEHADLPWNCLSFVLGDTRYSCCYLDRPENPKEARYSERDYGRFGSYFEYTLPDNEATLDVSYRLWLQEGEMDVAEVQALDDDFVDPPQATIN